LAGSPESDDGSRTTSDLGRNFQIQAKLTKIWFAEFQQSDIKIRGPSAIDSSYQP